MKKEHDNNRSFYDLLEKRKKRIYEISGQTSGPKVSEDSPPSIPDGILLAPTTDADEESRTVGPDTVATDPKTQ
jgi:hypothetical protein